MNGLSKKKNNMSTSACSSPPPSGKDSVARDGELNKLCHAAQAYALFARESRQVLSEISDQTSLEAALERHTATTNSVLHVALFQCLPAAMARHNFAPDKGARYVACMADELIQLMACIVDMTALDAEQALEIVKQEAAQLTSQPSAAVLGVALEDLFRTFVPTQQKMLIVKFLSGKHLMLEVPLPCTAQHLMAHEQVKAVMRNPNRVIYCGKLVGVVTCDMAEELVHIVASPSCSSKDAE